MPDPTRGTIHVDGPLSDIAVAYKNEEYIADQIFPVVPVPKQSDLYFIWTKGYWLRNQVERRAPGDTYPEGRLRVSNTSYYCNMYHLGYPIADEDRDNEDPAIQLEQTGAEWLADQFLLNREIVIAADIFTTSIWATDVVGGTGFTAWDDYENSTPISDITTGKQMIQKSTGKRPNTLLIGQEVLDILVEHPNLLDRYKHTQVGILDEEEVRKALKVERLVVGGAVNETSIEGAATAVRAFIWGKNALLAYVPPAPGIRVAAAGYTFVWQQTDGGGLTVPVRNTREDNRDRDLLKGKHAFDNKIVGSDLGYFFSAAVS